MTAPDTTRLCVTHINQLRTGATYRATTRNGTATGEYLGMETPHGVRAILLQHPAGTHSIPLRDVTCIHPLAA